METKRLEQRIKELKQRLSALGKMVHEGKYWTTIHCNGLNVMKKRLYALEREMLQHDDIWNYSKIKASQYRIEILNLKRDIEQSKQQLKEEEKHQRELIYEVKNLNREYSKLERRLELKCMHKEAKILKMEIVQANQKYNREMVLNK